MTPRRTGAVVGALLVGLPLVLLAPILFSYVGADIAYRARVIGEWASLPAAILGCLVLLAIGVAGGGVLGAVIGHFASKPLK